MSVYIWSSRYLYDSKGRSHHDKDVFSNIHYNCNHSHDQLL